MMIWRFHRRPLGEGDVSVEIGCKEHEEEGSSVGNSCSSFCRLPKVVGSCVT